MPCADSGLALQATLRRRAHICGRQMRNERTRSQLAKRIVLLLSFLTFFFTNLSSFVLRNFTACRKLKCLLVDDLVFLSPPQRTRYNRILSGILTKAHVTNLYVQRIICELTTKDEACLTHACHCANWDHCNCLPTRKVDKTHVITGAFRTETLMV